MDISHTENSLMGIKILLPTLLSEESMNAIRRTAKEKRLKSHRIKLKVPPNKNNKSI